MTSRVDDLRDVHLTSLPRSLAAIVATVVLAASFVALACLAASPPVPAPLFISLFAAAWVSYAVLFWTPAYLRTLVAIGVAAAVAARVAGVLSTPIYEDDWARYLWDGHRLIQDGTPYLHAPSEYFEKEGGGAWAEVLGQINHPEVPTIYAPALQLMFALATAVSPASLLALKLVLVAFDLSLWLLIWRRGGAVAGLRYALCPLVIFEVSFNAHADIIGTAFVFLSYVLVTHSHRLAAGAAFALALASKPLAIVLVPALIDRRWYVTAFASALALAALYAPFVATGGTEIAGIEVFSRWWEFNSLGFAALKEVFGDPAARALGLALGISIAATLMSHWLAKERERIPPVDLWVLALLVFAPVINPWYLLWAVPWACVRPNAVTWAVLPAVSISYLTTGVLGVESDSFHNHLPWVRPLEVGTAAAILLILKGRGILAPRDGKRSGSRTPIGRP